MSVASNFSESLGAALDQLAQDEWAVVRACEAATHAVSPSDAFESVVEVLGLAEVQTDSYGFASCCCVALSLAKIANTTQRPAGLEGMLTRIEPRAHNLGCTKELAEMREWYRLAA